MTLIAVALPARLQAFCVGMYPVIDSLACWAIPSAVGVSGHHQTGLCAAYGCLYAYSVHGSSWVPGFCRCLLPSFSKPVGQETIT